jgi:two-component system KDP operon response regulator KdpE
MARKRRLLLADNNQDYRESVRGLLELEENEVVEAASEEEAIRILEDQKIDLVLADLRLTDDADTYDFSGLRLAKVASQMRVPVLIVTSFPTVDATRLALRSAGREPLAVDIVPKKEGAHALLAAVKSALQGLAEENMVARGDLVVDVELRMAWHKGQTLPLSRNQYELLAYLFQNAGAVCSPEELIKAVYNEDLTPELASADRRLERLAERLREKVEDDPKQPRYIVREPRRGFRLVLNH